MRRMIALMTTAALALVAGGGVALAATIQCGGGACFGTDRADTMYGTNQHDAIFAKKGGDFVTGRKGADDLNGQDGNDRVLGGRGNDWVKGGRHDDTVKGGKGHDTITGGSGDNVIRAADGMRDRIVCGDNSRNVIHYDPGLDHFKNCVFEQSLQANSSKDSPALVAARGNDSGSASGD